MALIYTYDDEFVINSIAPEKLDGAEADAIIEADALLVTAEPYREKVVKAIVYMNFARLQLEAEGMKDKLDTYQKQYDQYYNLSKTSNPSGVSNIPLGRG